MANLERVIVHTDDPSFFHHLKDIVWFLKIVLPLQGFDKRERPRETYATAFALNKDGLVMTAAHPIPKGAKILARKVDDNEFRFEAETAYEKPRFDIYLLNIQGAKDRPYGRLAEDGSLSFGQTVYHIGSPFEFVWSFLKGEVVYPCINDVTLPTNNLRCVTYDSTAYSSNPTYRMMGHIWNRYSFDPKPDPNSDPKQSLLRIFTP